ncbi:deleted in malignant brain tumors 1 protein-like isoform X3 [Mytilus californianus]|uniref:deleted in malignant brain tumors 1 protein-like isoform X3 n=1 Tax=Mytilus californianus TaxID=6549 RepID=UPI00224704C3|nr:deleted in malignant brain tumors 1 protein-like isoform X3 [Mytilus californianus]
MEVTYGKQRFLEILIVLLSTCLVHVAGDCAGLVSTLIADFNSYKTVTTDDYPSPYANSLTCEWKIDSDSAADKVAITYLAFNLETNFDKLKIYDGDSASSRLSYIDTGSLDDRFYISSGRYLFLRFTTDSSVKWSGFKIQYITILGSMIKPNCVDTITLDESSANIERQYALHTFSSPFTSSFYSTCEWTINSTANAQFSINIVYTDFDDFSTYTCDQTTGYGLSIWEDSVIKYQLCDFLPDSLVSMYASGGHTNTVKFRTPIINGVDRGFIITLKYIGTIAVPSSAIPTVASLFSACGSQSNPTRLTVDNVTEQFVISPGYPGQYANNLDCWWILSSSTGIRIRPYHIFIEAADIITIYDGPTSGYVSLASFYGTYSSHLSTYLSTGSSVTIRFSTDGSTTDTGFSIGYIESSPVIPSCAPNGFVLLNATTTENTLQSHAGYGSTDYMDSLNSYWLIDTGLSSSTIYIEFNSFHIESSVTCAYDYVKVYAGACVDEDNRIQFLCGQQADISFSSTQGRYVLIHFRTDHSINHQGWELKYSTSDSQTEASTAESNDWWRSVVGVVIGIIIFIIFFCFCCNKKNRTKNAKSSLISTPATSFQQPPVRKTILNHVVITKRPPKTRPAYEIDTRKRQQKRNQHKETVNLSISLNVVINQPALQPQIQQTYPPPNYFGVQQREDPVYPPIHTDQTFNQNQNEMYNRPPYHPAIDPNDVPSPFTYTDRY